MSDHFLIIGLSFLVCLIIAAISFVASFKTAFFRDRYLSAAISFGVTILAGVIPLTFFFWYPHDFTTDISVWQYALSLICGLLILLAFPFQKLWLTALAVLIASASGVLITGIQINFFPNFPGLINQILTIAALWLFAFGWRAVAGLNPLPQIEGISICGGILLLYLCGMAPFILGVSAAGVLAALTIAYLHGSRQPFGINAAPFLGFVTGWFGLICSGEYLLSCFVVFSLFYLIEFGLALTRRLTFLPQYQELAYNSASVQSFSDGFPAQSVLRVIWSTNILMIVFGLIQVNSTNAFSIPAFAALIAGWQIYRLMSWRNASQTLAETNRLVLQNFKDFISDFLSSKKNNKPDKN